MCATVVLVGPGRSATGRASTGCKILAGLLMLLGIEVSFGKDVHLALPGPVPINDLLAKVGHIPWLWVFFQWKGRS